MSFLHILFTMFPYCRLDTLAIMGNLYPTKFGILFFTYEISD